MTRLSQSDLDATLRFLRRAEAVSGPDPFPSDLLDALRELVPCDFVGYCELDRIERRILFYEGCSQQHEAAEANGLPPDEPERHFWRLIEQHPFYRQKFVTGDFSAHKYSDFVTRRQLHSREIYADYLRPIGVEYEIAVGLPHAGRQTKVFLFASGSRDFGERDRIVLDRLRPHLAALEASARERRRAAALLLDHGRGLVVLQSWDQVDFATPAAARLLALYFPQTSDGRLPEPVRAWLHRDAVRLNGNGLPRPAAEPLRVERGDHRLTIRRAGHVLLLDEQIATLTSREREIVDHLAEGRTNAEIAERLTIAPTTVRKHLENIYAKLGVHSRSAAVAATRRARS